MNGKDIERVLIKKEDIDRKTVEIARRIGEDYKGQDVLFVCVLRGAFMFFADLVRAVAEETDVNAQVDFIAVSSYGAGVSSTGEVKFIKDLTTPIAGKNVVIVEDIVDTGITLSYLKDIFLTRRPLTLRICAMLNKPSRRVNDLEPDYKLFDVPDEFVIGCGLDYNEDYRALPDVCVLSPSVYEDKTGPDGETV